jgi:hypothetical protein
MSASTTVDGAPTLDAGTSSPTSQITEGHTLASRYRLRTPIGQGGFGAVWRAWDALDEVEVAIKLIPGLSSRQIDQIRREVAALRWADFPGVVRLRDDGIDGQHWFLVMDLVEGRPLGMFRRRITWDSVRGPIVALFETLARVHSAGLVHGDLKPENILLTPDRTPVLLDFGLVRGIDAAGDKHFAGTPQYCAPEQVAQRGIDARSDLYSVGVVMFELLAGVHPHGKGATVQEFLAAKLMRDAPPLITFAPEVPVTVAMLVDELLSRDPDRRPDHAAEVLARLGAGVANEVGPDRFEAVGSTVEGLRTLFAGDDAFDHRAERCARQLMERTAGLPEAASDEVASWLRAGLAHRDGDRVHVQERALAQLESGLRVSPARDPQSVDGDADEVLAWIRAGWPDVDLATLGHLLPWSPDRIDAALADLLATGLAWEAESGRLCAGARVLAGPPPAPDWRERLVAACEPSVARLRHVLALGADDIAEEALATSRALIVEGQLGGARAALELGLAATSDRVQRLELAERLTEEALASEDARELDRIATAISLRLSGTPEVQRLEDLLRASRSALRGERERAAEILARVPPLHDEALEIWRQAMRVLVSSLYGPEQELALLEALHGWARRGSPLRLAKLQGWMGNHLYRQGDFARASELQRAALEGKRRPNERLSARTNLAAALLDELRFADCAVAAESAAADARRIGHRRFEAIAVFNTRSAAYRSGEATDVREDLVEAGARIGPYFEGLFALNEAAVAWRLGQPLRARALAERSATAFTRAGLSDQALLGRILERVVGERTGQHDEALADQARRCRPGLALQALGLLRRVRPDLVSRDELDQRAAHRPREQWGVRLDLISIEEALAT